MSMVTIAIKPTLMMWDTDISLFFMMAEITAVHVSWPVLVAASLILLAVKPTLNRLLSTVGSQELIIFTWGSIRDVILILVLLAPHRGRNPVMFMVYRRTI